MAKIVFKIRMFRLLIGSILFIGCLYFLIPACIEGWLAHRLESIDLGEEGHMRISHVSFERFHQVHIEGLVLGIDEREQPLIQIEQVVLKLDPSAFLRGRLEVDEILLEHPSLNLSYSLDGSSDIDPILRMVRRHLANETEEQDGPDDEEDQEESSGLNRVRQLINAHRPSILFEGGRLSYSQQGAGQEDLNLVEDISGQVLAGEEAGLNVEIRADLVSVAIPEIEAMGPLQFSLEQNPTEDRFAVDLSFDTPVRFSGIPGITGGEVSLQSVGFLSPNSFSVEGLMLIESETDRRLIQIGDLTFSLRTLTLDPEEIYLSMVEAREVILDLDLDTEDGIKQLAMFDGIHMGERAGSSDTVDGEGEIEGILETDDMEERAHIAARWNFCAGRKWNECAPQTLLVEPLDILLTVPNEEAETEQVAINFPSIRASQRLINFQMDLSTSMTVAREDGDQIVSMEIDWIYYWMTKRWRTETHIQSLDLGQTSELISAFGFPAIESGDLSLDLTIRENRPDGGNAMRLSSHVSLTDFMATFEAVDTVPVEWESLEYDFTARFDASDHFSMSRSQMTLGEVEASIGLELDALDLRSFWYYLQGFRGIEDAESYWSSQVGFAAPIEQFRFYIDMPSTDIMTLYHSIPTAFRSDLEGVEMAGNMAWQLDLTGQFERQEDGRLRVEINEPDVSELSLEEVELVSIPEAIDVRMLNDQMAFTFTDGEGESRSLDIGVEGEEGWVAFNQVNPYLVTSLLHSEDQGYFRPGPFNWYQFRRVVAQVLGEQQLGRGASTISMQLIKNVFLSRERVLSRKVSEMFLAGWLNRFVTKERILEIYLNVIEFGPGINGIGEASAHYFGKLPSQLTLMESVFLISLVPSPRRYHQFYETGEVPEYWLDYISRTLNQMRSREVITEAEDLSGRSTPFEFYYPNEGEPLLRNDLNVMPLSVTDSGDSGPPDEEPALGIDTVAPVLEE
jgi:hypothetical protein